MAKVRAHIRPEESIGSGAHHVRDLGEDDAAEASRRLAALGLDLEGESGKWRIRDNTHRYLEGYAL